MNLKCAAIKQIIGEMKRVMKSMWLDLLMAKENFVGLVDCYWIVDPYNMRFQQFVFMLEVSGVIVSFVWCPNVT